MSALTDIQYIEKNGKREFVILKYDEFREMMKDSDEFTVPHEVVSIMVDEDISPLKAWRKYLGVTQRALAKKMKITAPALCQMEKSETIAEKTRMAAAKALNIKPEQLDW
jgi:DNA-binding XRE family transcriptional regulator